MAVKIQFRRDTTHSWAYHNPVLSAGEMGINTDTNLFKIGDGLTAWNDLDYVESSVAKATVQDAKDGTDDVLYMTPLLVRESIDEIKATQAEAEAGTSSDVLMTPLRVRDSITGVLATQIEAETGTSNEVLMTPLRVRDSITEILATQAEAEEGTSEDKLMTPKKTHQAINEVMSVIDGGEF